ncbi:hypothetical protein HN011_010151 [Eciton burchellii]|nr:hypothetical protein HN011_010151 [Eciton burchellii]
MAITEQRVVADGSRESETIENRWLSESHVAHSDIITEKMKSCTLVFVTVAAVLLYSGYASAREICAPENCLGLDQCQEAVRGDVLCQQQSTSCCSIGLIVVTMAENVWITVPLFYNATRSIAKTIKSVVSWFKSS